MPGPITTETRQRLIDKLFGGADPYVDWHNRSGKRPDHTYPHTALEAPLIARALEMLPSSPRLIVEVGSFKGGSAIRFATYLKRHEIDATVICIDTFLGGVLMWMNHNGWRDWLSLQAGQPTIFDQFMANTKEAGHHDIIVPFVTTSTVALTVLDKLGERADIAFLDASHQQGETALELALIRRIMRPGGVIIGDDYNWPGVRHDLDAFVAERGLKAEVIQDRMWLVMV